jgi:hypothetical protein
MRSLIAPYALFRLPYDASLIAASWIVFHETAQGIEIPCSIEKIPCSREKIPCSGHLRELAGNILKLRTNYRFSRVLREFDDNALK